MAQCYRHNWVGLPGEMCTRCCDEAAALTARLASLESDLARVTAELVKLEQVHKQVLTVVRDAAAALNQQVQRSAELNVDICNVLEIARVAEKLAKEAL